ncbi:hypothetical protein O181_012908 [Austropuccinia psidii MF-1]|uniref:Integrase catalytic domain-containing protein n=1 Tax=Austropuccinia psidii MF-1 TaxID=1389203 RepID=A0A9Q3BXN4_9BASI|nr:hypothetical protein [Austropuccinia psidii MF-1]
MSDSTCAKKAADDDAEPKPLSNNDMYSMLNSLKNKVMKSKSARSSDAAKIQSLQMALSSPPPASFPWAPMPQHTVSAYDCFMQEPYRTANCFAPLKSDGSNFSELLTCLDQVLSVAFNTEMLVDDSPSSLYNRLPEENRAICHFIDASIPHKFALCVGITPSQSTVKAFFVATKACCFPRNRFEKLWLVRSMLTMLVKNGSGTPRPNNVIIISLCLMFVLLKKLGIEANELEGLLAQAACHAPATLNQTAFDQLVTTAILARGEEKPNSTFVGQVILNASTKTNKDNCQLSPFVYRVEDPPATLTYPQRPRSLGPTQSWRQAAEVRHPPDHLVDRFGAACFHCGGSGHWRADCPNTKGVTNPNPRPPRPKTLEERPSSASGSQYQRERVSQVQFVEHHAADKVLIDSGASIHLSGSEKFETDLHTIHPFCIFFVDSNSSITITQIAMLRIPVEGGIVVISNVPFSNKSRSDAPAAVLDAITHLTVQLETSPKALKTDNAREFTSGCFTAALTKLGIGFYPSLPYLPQENGEAKCLNQALGDMARAMLTKSGMPSQFWQLAYAIACYLHNRLPNPQCPNSSPHQVLYGRPPQLLHYIHSGKGPLYMCWQSNSHTSRMQGALSADFSSRYWPLVSAIFPRFQMAQSAQETLDKGSLRHVLNTMTLGQVPTEVSFACKERAINSLPLAKDILIPESLKQALAGPDWHYWEQACLDKLHKMKKRGIWQAIKKTLAMKTIGHWWVFDTKIDELGNIEKFKAQLVACSNQQRLGIDCKETYAPTVSLMSLRLLLATAFLQHWKVCSFNVSGAYLYSPVEETILMEPPTHFIPSLKGKVLHLWKALYGMKQACRCWWLHLLGILEGLGFTSCKVDMSLYVFWRDETIIAIWIHIDDGVITSNLPTAIERFREALCKNFEIKWSENMKQIVELECAFGEGEVTILQTRLTDDILDTYPRRILQRDSPLPPIPTTISSVKGIVMDAMPFRLVVGSLAYLVSGLHPDLAFSVNYLARHSTAHWDILDHLVGYLLKTRGHGIILRPGECALSLWGGKLERSQSGFMLKLGNAPILWVSKRQTMVALSMCAAEYIALSDSTQHLVQAINQLTQLAQDFKKTIFCNNQAAVQVSINNLSQKRMRYLDHAFFFVNTGSWSDG